MMYRYCSTFLITALSTPLAYAINAENTYHSEFNHRMKIDHTPTFAEQTLLTDEDLVLQFLKDNHKKYGLESELDNLELVKVKPSLLAKHFYLQQHYNGTPIEKAEIIVSISNKNKVLRVFNHTVPNAKLSKNSAKGSVITEKSALEKAWKFLQVSGKLYTAPKAHLTYVNTGSNLRLAYKTSITVSQPLGDWMFIVDAYTGNIITAEKIDISEEKSDINTFSSGKAKPFPINKNAISLDTAISNLDAKTMKTQLVGSQVDAQGLVFAPNPVITLSNEELEDDSDSSLFEPAYTTVTLEDVTLDEDGHYHLTGPWVTLADFEEPNVAPSSTNDGNWQGKRGDVSFNDAMTYYHLDQNQRYMQSLGFVGETGIQYNSIQVDANGLDGADNSHFIPSTNQVAFGHGCVDDNEDADVILHEYGHAINFSINDNWGGGDTGGMGEGFGDYWAKSYAYTTPNGLDFHPEWVFSWDGHNECWGGRQVNRTDFRYDPTQTYGAHAQVNGELSDELWSTPLTQSLLQLMDMGVTREDVDTIILEAQFGLGANLRMPDMANAIIATANAMFPEGPHAQVFTNNFKLMNILGEPLTPGDLNILNNDPVILPGDNVELNISLLSIRGTLEDVSTVLTSMDENITITQAEGSYPEVGESATFSDVSYTLDIAANHACEAVELALETVYSLDDELVENTFSYSFELGERAMVSGVSTPALDIPDNTEDGITDTLILEGSDPEGSISVDLNITHTYIGDLLITLTSPAGTTLTLWDQEGSSGVNIIGNFPNDFDVDLSVFNGENHNGEWALFISDNAAIDTGALQSWGINVISPANCTSEPEPTPEPTPTSNEGGGGAINWIHLFALFPLLTLFRRKQH